MFIIVKLLHLSEDYRIYRAYQDINVVAARLTRSSDNAFDEGGVNIVAAGSGSGGGASAVFMSLVLALSLLVARL